MGTRSAGSEAFQPPARQGCKVNKGVLALCYDDALDAETRTRYQMLLLAQRGQTLTQIAAIVLRSQDTIVRVLR